jgi:hypothetical protein
MTKPTTLLHNEIILPDNCRQSIPAGSLSLQIFDVHMQRVC